MYTACVFVLKVSSHASVEARKRCSDRDVAEEKSSDSLFENLSSSSNATPALLTRRWRADSFEESSCVSF